MVKYSHVPKVASLQYLKKEVKDEIEILCIQIKMILLLLLDIVKHS